MKKLPKRKLVLSREAIKTLGRAPLAGVAGGSFHTDPTDSCLPSDWCGGGCSKDMSTCGVVAN